MTDDKKALTGDGASRSDREFAESGGIEKKGAQVVNYDLSGNFELPNDPPPGMDAAGTDD